MTHTDTICPACHLGKLKAHRVTYTQVFAGDFIVTTKVRPHPAHQYDQAGLMVRVGSSCWIKTSVEYESEGPSKVGAVDTNHSHSDWSLQDFPRGRNEVRLRIRREAQDFLVEWSPAASGSWELLRVTHLHEGDGQPAETKKIRKRTVSADTPERPLGAS